jgi:acyl carrier protein
MSTVEQTLEAELRELLASRLGVDVPDPALDMVEAGLIDSLVLVEMLFEIEAEFGVPVELDQIDLDDFRTVRRIAAWIAARAGEHAAAG